MKMQRKSSLIFGVCALFALCAVFVGVCAAFSSGWRPVLAAARAATLSQTVSNNARSKQPFVAVTVVNPPNVTVEELRPADGSIVWQKVVSNQAPSGKGWTMVEASSTIYVIRWNTTGGTIYALSAINGHMLWQKQTAPIFGVTPGQGNGLLYVATSNFSNSQPASAISAWRVSDGSQVWNVKVKKSLTGGFVATANALYTATIPPSNPSTTTVLALQLSNGNTFWQHTIAGPIPYPNGLEANAQTVFVATTPYMSGAVYALNATSGAQLWHYTNNSSGIVLSPRNANGAVYVAAFNGSFCSLQASDGKQLWCYQNSRNLFPVAAAYGDIYAGAYQSPRYSFCALKASNATRLWCSPIDSFAPIEAGTQDTVYTTTVQNSLYAFQNSNGKLLWRQTMNGSVFGLAIAQ